MVGEDAVACAPPRCKRAFLEVFPLEGYILGLIVSREGLLIAVTETTNEQDIEILAQTLGEVLI